jgi:two-component system response regulator RstA
VTVILKISPDSLCKFDIKQIRINYSGPLILLTDKTDAKYHISTLGLGFDELLNISLNIESQINRVKILIEHWESNQNSKNNTIKIRELKITLSRREVFLRNELVNIKSIEFEILWYLANNAGKTVSRNELHNALYRSDYNGIDRALDIYISRIRSKLCDDPKDPKYIKTVRTEGYLFLPEF